MLNLYEHELYPDHYFKMPTIVGIFNFMTRINGIVGVYVVCRVLIWSLFCHALLHAPFSFAIILTRKRELVALLLLSFGCLVTVNVL